MQGLLAQPPYPWFTDIWSQLNRMLDLGTLPHAILLSGSAGMGLESLAQAFAQRLLCIAPLQGQSCGKCKACQLVASGNHPDARSLHPEEKAKAIKIDQVRALSEFIGGTAQQSGRKVITLYPAEAMNPNAANAILKNLEEPTDNTVFILVSFQAAMLMATIRSRCTQIKAALPKRQQAIDWLQRMQIKQDPAPLLDMAGGKPLTVLQWIDEGSLGHLQELEQSLVAISEQQANCVAIAKKWGSFDPLWVVDQLMILVLSNMKTATVDGELKRGALQALSQRQLVNFYDHLKSAKTRLLSTANPNVPLLLEGLSMYLEASFARVAR